MKVLCINTNGLRNDGITNSIVNYYRYIDKSNMTIDMLKTRDVEEEIEKKITDIGVGLKFTDYRSSVVRYILKTAKLIKLEKYDIVHVHGSSSILTIDLLAAWLGGCKIRIAHSRNTTCDHKVIDKILRPLFHILCTERFACGEDAGKWLFNDKAFHVIKNGKDLKRFKFNLEIRDRVREENNWNEKIVIGHVGNFNYQKNHDFLIDVFSELCKVNPMYQLVLMGTGKEYMVKAQKKVEELGISDKVLFMGSVDNVEEIQQAVDVMLFPSHFEGLPNVVLEWQISGLPSIISDKITKECAVTDLVSFLPIDQGTEIWVSNVMNLNLVDRLEASEVACDKMIEAGFDIHDNAKKLKNHYERLVGKE